MAYTPELSLQDSSTLRRIAWALGIPMTKAIVEVISYTAKVVDSSKVCESCKDKSKCEGCAFSLNS